MGDNFLFGVAPGIAALSCVSGGVVRYVMRRRGGEHPAPRTGHDEPTPVLTMWWRCSIAVVLLGHALAFAFPSAVLFWNRQLPRLILLESVGLAAGTIALVGVLGIVVRSLRSSGRREPTTVEVIAATLVLLEMISGILVAVQYRWASSWTSVTLTPYVHSLLHLKPSVVLVAHMPFLVKLHVFCAFGIVAITPLTRMAHTVAAPFREVARTTATPVVVVYRPVWRLMSVWTTPVARTGAQGNEEP